MRRYIYIRRIRVNGRTYRYVVVEEHDGRNKREVLRLRPEEAIMRLMGRRNTQEHVEVVDKGFLEWCVETASPATCKKYMRYLEQPLDRNNRWSTTAYKKYMRYLCIVKGDDRACERYSKIPLIKSKPDKYVPGVEDIVDTLRRLREPYFTIYRVLVETGLRLVEALYLIRNISSLRRTRINDYYRVELDLVRGKKKAFVAYLSKIPEISLPPWRTHKAVSNYARRNAIIMPKYIRKFVATTMIRVGIPVNIVDFIQGRTPSSVIASRYLELVSLADQFYQNYYTYIQRHVFSELR